MDGEFRRKDWRKDGLVMRIKLRVIVFGKSGKEDVLKRRETWDLPPHPLLSEGCPCVFLWQLTLIYWSSLCSVHGPQTIL